MNRPVSMHLGHRPMLSSRITELLENLKTEYDNISSNANTYKLQRDDFERKLQQHAQDAQNIQQQIYELERNHQKMKQKYEEEILLLRRQLGHPEQQSLPPNRSLSGEKRPLSSIEVGAAQDLGSLAKRHRELPAPLAPGGSPSNNNTGGSPYPSIHGSMSISQIAKQNGPPKRNAAPDITIKQQLSPQPSNPSQSMTSPQLTSQSSQPQAPTPSNSSSQLQAPPSPAQQQQQQSSSQNGQKKKRQPMSPDTSENEGGSDWMAGYNPGVSRKLDVKLDHDMEHDSVVCCVNFSADGKYLATGCNHSAQIYDVATGAKVHTFRDKPDSETDLYIRSVSFSPDGKFLATGAEDKTVKLWDIEKEQIRYNLSGHELDIYSLDFSSDGRYVISGSGDKKVKIWRMEDAKCMYTLGDETSGPRDGVTSVAISPDGRQVAAGSLDRVVRLWEIETGTFIGKFEGHTDSVYSVAFSPDGKTLASGSLDKTLKLWDLSRQNRQRCRITLTGHRDFVLSVAFSPDGNWLVSGSKDRSVQFWDPRTSITHIILQGHRNSVISVALTGEKDGSSGKFATGSGDWRARIWQYQAGTFPSSTNEKLT